MGKTYDRLLEMCRGPGAVAVLVVLSFLEGIIFPIPPEAFFIPMVLGAPKNAFRIVSAALAANLLGGACGYLVGRLAMDTAGMWLLNAMGAGESFASFTEGYIRYGFWLVFMGGFTPFPYKVICLASGAVGLDFRIFLLSSVVSRALRFYIVAWLLRRYGERANRIISGNFGLITTLFFIMIVLGFYAVRWL
ncbi:MAG: DedA family protein [Rickettsiales bacterium]|jgi:membrane protein YqaA with SNARE-associated domain|nr:DedA family protein [Rickettsiales bacterium]